MTEKITNETLKSLLEKEKENDITDMAFMTWIKNPVFQKYYHDTRAFKEIAEKYVTERCQQ